VSAGVSGRDETVAEDFQAYSAGGEQHCQPANQGHITVECGAVVHHSLSAMTPKEGADGKPIRLNNTGESSV
jgi:hypothetical protein